jgi:flagellin
MNEVHSILQRMRELTVQAANDTNASEDRDAIKLEQSQLVAEIDRIADETQFNGKTLLAGDFKDDGTSAAVGINLQVGANTSQSISFHIGDMHASALVTYASGTAASLAIGLNQAASKMSSFEDATKFLSTIDAAIKTVSDQRSTMGAVQNRLEHTIANADNTSENLQAAESRIRDVDMADEMVKYSKSSILQQAGQSMLAQANQSTQGVLSLLR